jgi:predicted nuclease of restriction endonuclease-like RecB superfamily
MPLLPESSLPFRINGGRVSPGYLDARDIPWLHVLIEEIDRFCSLPVRELMQRLHHPLPCWSPTFKRRAAIAVLLRIWKSEPQAEIQPDKAREVLFCLATEHPEFSRIAVLALASQLLGVEPGAIEQSLFADLPGERLVCAPATIPSPNEIALRTNLLVLRSLLFHARRVRIKAEGATRPLVRQAKLRGLICSVTEDPTPILELSGPYTVFRHTLLYGRALGELLQFLPHCAHFKLRAECVLRGQEVVLDVQSGDPIFPAESAKPYDSLLEERFAKDLRKEAPDWDLVREPKPIQAGSTIIFPDFLLRNRLWPERTFLVEIMGFWSAEYVKRKLEHLRQANLTNLILCVDEERLCGEESLVESARVVRFRRRIDPLKVLAAAGEYAATIHIATDLHP